MDLVGPCCHGANRTVYHLSPPMCETQESKACLLGSLWCPQLLEQCLTRGKCLGKYLLKSLHVHFWEGPIGKMPGLPSLNLRQD